MKTAPGGDERRRMWFRLDPRAGCRVLIFKLRYYLVILVKECLQGAVGWVLPWLLFCVAAVQPRAGWQNSLEILGINRGSSCGWLVHELPFFLFWQQNPLAVLWCVSQLDVLCKLCIPNSTAWTKPSVPVTTPMFSGTKLSDQLVSSPESSHRVHKLCNLQEKHRDVEKRDHKWEFGIKVDFARQSCELYNDEPAWHREKTTNSTMLNMHCLHDKNRRRWF